MTTIYVATSATAYLPLAVNDPSTGAASDASAIAAYTRSVGGSADAALNTTGVTVSLLSNAGVPPGLYEIAVNVSAAGMAAGETHNVYAAATVNDVQSVGAVGQIIVNELLTGKDVGLLLEQAISSIESQTIFEVSSIQTADNYNGATVIIEDVTNGDTNVRRVTDSDAANNKITIDSACTFTAVAGDVVRIRSEYHPTAALNDYDPPTRDELTTDKNSILDRLLGYVQLLVRSDAAIKADRASELTLINQDEGSGVGDYDNETDSQEHGNTKRINNTAVTGAGTSGDLWRGA